MPRRRRTRVGGDPYNSGELRQALSGYQKVSVPEVCGDPISRDNLAVWINQTGKWSEFDTSKLWLKRGPSLCRELVTELGMSSAQYESLRDVFNDATSTDLVGLYKKGGDYAIVLRVPQTSVLDKLAIGGAAGGGAIAGALTTWAARQNWTQKAKWIDAYSKFYVYGKILEDTLDSYQYTKHPFFEGDLESMRQAIAALLSGSELDDVYMPVPYPKAAFEIQAAAARVDDTSTAYPIDLPVNDPTPGFVIDILDRTKLNQDVENVMTQYNILRLNTHFRAYELWSDGRGK